MKRNNPLISVVTPCFNGEKYLRDFLDSLLKQTYYNYEFFFVNDGSTDNTEVIFKEYQQLFNAKGIRVIYKYQKNAGQAAAINSVLKEISGDYFIWLDCDDILMEDNFCEKVYFLEHNERFAFVMCQAQAINLSGKQLYKMGEKWDCNRDFFEDLVFENNVFFAPCMYMVRTHKLFEVIKEKSIQNSNVGQNWQLLLPLAYNFKCGYIPKVLCYYLIHNDSHSHCDRKLSDELERWNNQETLLRTLIDEIVVDENEKKDIQEKLTIKFCHKVLKSAWRFNEKKLFLNTYYDLKSKNVLLNYERKLFIIEKSILGKYIYLIIRAIWRKMRYNG